MLLLKKIESTPETKPVTGHRGFESSIDVYLPGGQPLKTYGQSYVLAIQSSDTKSK